MNLKRIHFLPGIFTFLATITVSMAFAVKTVVAQGVSDSAAIHWWLPEQGSSIAADVDWLFTLITIITVFFGLLVFVLMGYALIRYRARSGGAARYILGNVRLEILWTAIPAAILVVLTVLSQDLWSDIKTETPPEDALVIQVKPRQFQWDISYAGEDGEFGTPDDITSTNLLYVPVGTTVVLNMMAQDVIHSFFVPEFRIKQDAVPGMVSTLWFNATAPGTYEVACAELCGLGHYRMRGVLQVMEQLDYDAWYTDQLEKKRKKQSPVDTTSTVDSVTVMTETGGKGNG